MLFLNFRSGFSAPAKARWEPHLQSEQRIQLAFAHSVQRKHYRRFNADIPAACEVIDVPVSLLPARLMARQPGGKIPAGAAAIHIVARAKLYLADCADPNLSGSGELEDEQV